MVTLHDDYKMNALTAHLHSNLHPWTGQDHSLISHLLIIQELQTINIKKGNLLMHLHIIGLPSVPAAISSARQNRQHQDKH